MNIKLFELQKMTSHQNYTKPVPDSDCYYTSTIALLSIRNSICNISGSILGRQRYIKIIN